MVLFNVHFDYSTKIGSQCITIAYVCAVAGKRRGLRWLVRYTPTPTSTCSTTPSPLLTPMLGGRSSTAASGGETLLPLSPYLPLPSSTSPLLHTQTHTRSHKHTNTDLCPSLSHPFAAVCCRGRQGCSSLIKCNTCADATSSSFLTK